MVKVAGYTHIGKRSNNEDNYAIADNFAIVADGMGGHSKGEVASSMAADCIIRYLNDLDSVSDDDILNSIKSANSLIYNKSLESGLLRNMGTTVVMCAWHDNDVIVANVGDSRCYLFADEVKQITTDHSYVQSLVDLGEITKEEAEVREDKNIILRAVGCDATVKADVFKITAETGNTILLCSDGLSGVLSADEMSSIINSDDSVEIISKKLVDSAYSNGGTDNITAVVIRFE